MTKAIEGRPRPPARPLAAIVVGAPVPPFRSRDNAAAPRRPGLRFALVMACFGLALLALYRSPRFYGALAPLDPVVARATAALVGASGLAVERRGAVLAHPGGFSYEIYYRCTGLVVAAFLAAGLAAFPGRRRAKLVGALIGAALILALNFGRLVALYWIGVRHPGAFDFAHRVVGEAGMLAAVFAYWVVWLRVPLSAGR